MQTVEDLIVYGKSRVHSDFARMLLADLLSMNTLELYNCLDMEVDPHVFVEYKEKLKQVEEKKPIQYVMGNVDFYGSSFYIDENVLIPRFETEELVENTKKFIQKKFGNAPIRLLDLGCGSGVIGLTLKKLLPQIDVTLLDISPKALEVTRRNALQLGLSVHVLEGDMLDGIDEKFHVIISNPPYIRENEEIQEIVRENEPALALYGGEDGLLYYRKILSSCKKNLEKDFLIAFEIGEQQKEDIRKIVDKYFENVEFTCQKDLSGRDRMVFIESIF